MSKASQARALMNPKKPEKWQPTAIYKCSYCLVEKHVRTDLAPVELICLRCGRRARAKVKGPID